MRWKLKSSVRLLYKCVLIIFVLLSIQNTFQDLFNNNLESYLKRQKRNKLLDDNDKKKEATSSGFLSQKNIYESYTFDDHESYKGFIMDAWPPSKDRNITNYIANEFTKLPIRSHFRNKELLIVVQSRPSDIYLRSMWRYFIGKNANDLVSIIFIFGSEPGLDSAEKLSISEEMDRYNDIAYIDGLVEHYHNLTLKSLYTLKLFLNDAWYPNPPNHMLKIDIDVFVNIPKLFQEIIKDKKMRHMRHYLLGKCDGCDLKYRGHRRRRPLFLDQLGEEYQKESKFIIPSYMYNKDQYPTYLSGPAYLVHRSSAECILQQAKHVPLFALEDIYITGFVAQECNILRLNHPGFHTHSKEFDFDNDITNHLDYTNCIFDTNDTKLCSYDKLIGIESIINSRSKAKPNKLIAYM